MPLRNIGADIQIKNSNGNSPIHFAAANGRSDIVNILLDRGADIEDLTDEGKTGEDNLIVEINIGNR
jgi:ankyrin repeat protein